MIITADWYIQFLLVPSTDVTNEYRELHKNAVLNEIRCSKALTVGRFSLRRIELDKLKIAAIADSRDNLSRDSVSNGKLSTTGKDK